MDYKDVYLSCFETFETDVEGCFYSDVEDENLTADVAMQRLEDKD